MSEAEAAPQEGVGQTESPSLRTVAEAAVDVVSQHPQRFGVRDMAPAKGADRSPFDEGGEYATEGDEGPAVEPPAHWKPEAREVFGQLPPEAQQFVLERDAAARAHFERQLEQAKKQGGGRWPGLQNVLTGDIEQRLLRDYGSVEQGIADLFKIERFATEQPMQFIQWFAQSRGINLAQMLGGQQQAQGQRGQQARTQYLDPELKPLYEQVEQLKAVVQQREQERAREQQARQQQAAAEVREELASFETAVGPDGRPQFPHYADQRVRGLMAQAIRSGTAKTLEEAYEDAIWRVPDIRDGLIAQQAMQRSGQPVQKRQIADAARRKGVQVSGMGGRALNGRLVPKGASLSETVAAAYDRVTAGRA